MCSATRNANQISPLARQLQAIADELETIILACQSSHGLHSRARFEVKHLPDCIRLLCHRDSVNDDMPLLEVRPLFPGSVTQPDIVARLGHPVATTGIQAPVSVGKPNKATSTGQLKIKLCPVPPEIHFLNFTQDRRDRNSSNGQEDQQTTLLIIDHESSGHEQSAPPGLHRQIEQVLCAIEENQSKKQRLLIAHTILAKCNDSSVKCLDSFFSSVPDQHVNPFKTQQVFVNDSIELVALMSQSDRVLAPTVSYAIDAVNAGTPCYIYNDDNTFGTQHSDPAALTSDLCNPANTSIRCQRSALAELQYQALSPSQVIWKKRDLRLLIDRCLTVDNLHSLPTADSQTVDDEHDPVIPVRYSRFTQERSSFRRVKPKFRKLLHSPSRFCMDSKHANLRRFGRLVF